jgi:hypothetical protein
MADTEPFGQLPVPNLEERARLFFARGPRRTQLYEQRTLRGTKHYSRCDDRTYRIQNSIAT